LTLIYARPLLLVVYSTFIAFCTGRKESSVDETSEKVKIGVIDNSLNESHASELKNEGLDVEEEEREPSTAEERDTTFWDLPIILYFGFGRCVEVAQKNSNILQLS
jgi:hypothetical protein